MKVLWKLKGKFPKVKTTRSEDSEQKSQPELLSWLDKKRELF